MGGRLELGLGVLYAEKHLPSTKVTFICTPWDQARGFIAGFLFMLASHDQCLYVLCLELEMAARLGYEF